MLILVAHGVQAQMFSVKGRLVLDVGTDISITVPIKGVTVTAKANGNTAVSDSNGFFSIDIDRFDKLIVKTKPFLRKSILVEASDTAFYVMRLRLPIREDNSDKDVDVAVGYGYIAESRRTDAIQSVRAENNFDSYLDIWHLIEAKFNNIAINGGCVVVRGKSSILDGNCALFIVNGYEAKSIDHIHPTDIKEISLLKDGAAAIYGSRGGNGVFIINTK